MKFVELKRSLENSLSNVYFLCGNDRFLCSNATEIIKKKINLSFPDLNSIILTDETYSETALVEACFVLPFGDEFRLVIVKGVGDIKKPGEKLLKYLTNPTNTTIIVFVCPESNEYIKSIEKFGTLVDCNVLDEKTLSGWINNFLNKRSVKIDQEATLCLIEYTSSNLTRIASELEKLASFVGNGGVILKEHVDKFVVKDKEYQIYEFTEAIAQGKAELAVDMLYTLLDTQKSEFSIVTPLYNYFRRLLLIKTSSLTNLELAKEFKIKEFAVKKMREKTSFYSAKNLKKCVDIIAKCDLSIKSGKMNANVAVKTTVLQILQLRNR